MLLSDIRTFMIESINSPQWYLNKVGDKEKSITIYNRESNNLANIALGGLDNTSYTSKAISILVHWGKASNEAELKAQEVYNTFFGKCGIIGNKKIVQFKMLKSEPIYLGTDSNGIIEYVIPLDIIYER